MPATCPTCGTRKIRASQTRSIVETLGTVFGIYPLRCSQCKSRFAQKVWHFSEIIYARCPRCYRHDLTTWKEKYYDPPLSVRILLQLGAQPVRCEACRCNFASYRKLKQRVRVRPKGEQSLADHHVGANGKEIR